MAATEDHLRKRTEERTNAIAAVGAVIETIARDREPDLWERVFLVQAIGALFRGIYSLAMVDAQLALTPVAERSQRPNLPTDPFFEQCDLRTLRATLDAARAEPVRAHPHFGPFVDELGNRIE